MSVTVSDLDNADAAVEMHEQTVGDAVDERLDDAMDRERAQRIKAQIEEADAPEDDGPIEVEVAGHPVQMEPLRGLGEQTSLPSKFILAEKHDDDEERALALYEMLERLKSKTVHDDVFDESFWDKRSDEVVTDAYQDLALQSRGGENAGN